jgi:ATP-dependent Lhr-like helicase
VVLVDGELVLYVERGGRTLLTWTEDPALLREATASLAAAVRSGVLGRLTVQKADGTSVLAPGSTFGAALEAAGFIASPQGLRLRG